MSTERPQNIIIFSAGESEKNGNLKTVKSFLEAEGHQCHDWRELFHGAKNIEQIALLPMLLKKVPTFDFAIILSDGVDTLKSFRQESPDAIKRIMRDNVLFETGLCTMALGADRVILLIEDDIRIPEDLHGVGVGTLGVKNITYSNPIPEQQVAGNLLEKLQEAVDHIQEKSKDIYPIVIGAAISTADGYFNNFILRFWENISQGFRDVAAPSDSPLIHPAQEKITMRILIPRQIDETTGKGIWKYYQDGGFRKGVIPLAGFRGVEFQYVMDSDGNMTVCDIPTTVTASYNTVVDILQLEADDLDDSRAKTRFLLKELDSFHRTLKKVMVEEKVAVKERGFKKSEDEVKRIVQGMRQVQVEEVDI